MRAAGNCRAECRRITRSMAPKLGQALAMLAAAAAEAADEWWIIGSAAVMLHGGAVGHVKDVDLMMSAPDAKRLLQRAGVEPEVGTGTERFRSDVFGIWRKPPVPVEVFGGFSVADGAKWRDVALSTREAVTVGDARVYVPERRELVRLLRLFGRPKDIERVRLLGS